MLHGRVEERSAIEALLRRAHGGQGGGLVFRGEPGIGKTALLEYAAEEAAGMRILRTVGVEPEFDLGYATLHRLLLPALGSIDRLPAPQAQALGMVFGLADGPAPDRFLVALATLSLLSEIAGERPVLCLVDDAHWADAASLDALAFVARRLDNEPIALALAARADEGHRLEVAGLIDLSLQGLDREAVRALLAERDGDRLSVAELDELLAVSGGNPLAIRELPATAWRGFGFTRPLRLTAGLQRMFLDRVRRQDPAMQRLLLLIAADGSGRPETIRRAAAVFVPGIDLLDVAEHVDLVSVEATSVAVRHPLIRSAIYHGAGPAERRAAHRALAEASDTELDRRAWHLGQAADVPDEQVAAQLERAAEHALRRGGPAAAATTLARAAELSPAEPDWARRLVAAATAWWQGGHPTHAMALLDRAGRAGSMALAVRLDSAWLHASIQLRAGTASEALEVLLPVLPEALKADRHRLIQILMLLGEAAFRTNAAHAYNEIADTIEGLPTDGDSTDEVLIRMFRAGHRAHRGVDLGLHGGDLVAVESLTDPARLVWAGGLALGVGEREVSRRLYGRAVSRARTLGAASILAWALDHLVRDDLRRGRFGTAEANAEEGHRIATETAQPNLACRHRGSLALIAATRGREQQARRLAESVLAEASDRYLAGEMATAYRALGKVELAVGRPDEALEYLEAMGRDGGPAHPGIAMFMIPELVEAAVRADRPERAAQPLARFATWADATTSPELRALAARCRALLADGEVAEAEFQQALELHAESDTPLERAHTQLLYGEHLRRERRRSDARSQLRAALDTFRRLGAGPWAERAHDELRASGETVRPDKPSALGTLTPQEFRIATAVSEGATNREIAARLLLSTRTVDYHLRKIFQRLGIGSRAELIRIVLGEIGDLTDSRGTGRGPGER